MDLLGEHGVQHAPQQVVGVAQEEEEHGDDEGRVDDVPLGQDPLDQGGTPHQDAGSQGQPLVVGDNLETGIML